MQENESQNLALIKAEILKDFRQRVADKIMEQENCDLLTRLISYAQNEKEAQDIAALGTKWVRTGFHFDFRAEKSTDEIAYLKRNENLSFANDTKRPTHKLIIGDNYHALLNLLITYREKIKVIYIDPPYGKDDMGEFADTNYDNAITRDNLLSMLKPRLQLAKMLLRDDGVIFCSIDDKNQAYLKCLFDEIFGEGNFVACAVRQTRSGGGFGTSDVGITHDYILTYMKDKDYSLNKIEKAKSEILKYFNLKDKFGDFHKRELKQSETQAGSREDRPFMFFPILSKKGQVSSIEQNEFEQIYKDGKFNDDFLEKLKKKYKEFDFVLPIKNNGEFGRWTCGFSGFLKLLKENKLMCENDKIYKKEYLDNDRKSKVATFLLTENNFFNGFGTTELKSIFNKDKVFDNPKPINLIKRLLEVSTIPNSPEFNGGGQLRRHSA